VELLDFVKNKNFVNGKWISTADYIEVINPATLQVIAKVPGLNVHEIREAIDSTSDAFKNWSQTAVSDRVKFLKKWHDAIIAHTDELAYIITLEQGKTLQDSKREVAYGASFVEWFANIILEVKSLEKVGNNKQQKIITEFEAVGPVAAITPWNFPLAMITRKISPALAAGCSVLLKPSSLTPFTALALVRLAELSGLPAGVINIITGDSNLIGNNICDDFRIRKISFTGSTEVGKILYKNCAETLKRLSLELGGNAPFIVTQDINIPKVVDDLIIAKTRSNGESCTAPNRIYIHSNIYEEFTTILTAKFSKIKTGNGLEIASDIGPLINQAAVSKISKLIEEAKLEGAQVTCGGDSKNNFYGPTVIINCTDSMAIAKTEIFGPVLACYRFETIDEVMERANNTEYGLQAYVYSNDKNIANKLSKELDFGMVSINLPLPSNARAPFSGRKASGFGIEGGEQGIFEYLNTKYVNLVS
jgi:succinate-semialdehyde dehydrogenase/glutarate-semialdehyde dehydrogenase